MLTGSNGRRVWWRVDAALGADEQRGIVQPRREQRARVGERAVRFARAGDHLARVGVQDVARGVDRDDGGYDQAVRHAERRAV